MIRLKSRWFTTLVAVLVLAATVPMAWYLWDLESRPSAWERAPEHVPEADSTPEPPTTTPTTSPTASPSPRPSPSPSPSVSLSPSAKPPAKPPAGRGTVFFEDQGNVANWNNYPQHPQKDGVLRTVRVPSFEGKPVIEAQQTYINEGGGYHSETVQHGAQRVGEDRYFGQAIMLPKTWQFHDQNVTYQQFSPENPSGPWLLMYVENDELRFGGSGGIRGSMGKITRLRGTWISIVVRLKLARSHGAFEVWVNGTKVVSRTNLTVLPKTANSIRWSSGMYCTGWRKGTPAGQRKLSIYHAKARIASTYALAEPANW